MKKIVSLITIICFALLFVACSKTYTVNVVVDGTQTQTFTVSDGQTLENHDFGIDPIQYDIDGWYNNGVKFDLTTPVTSDLTLTASTTDKEYKIVFKNDDGRVLKTRTYFPYEDIEKPSNPTKTKDAEYEYVFAGWDQEFDVAVKDMVITATYTKVTRKYDVTILNVDGSTKETLKVEYGKTVDLPTVTRESNESYSYTFSNWVTSDGVVFDATSTITANTKLSPNFTRSPLKHSTTGMKISILGDSVSTFYKEGDPFVSSFTGNDEYYYPKYGNWITSGSQTWWGQLITKLGGTLGLNNSLSGSCCYNWGSETQTQAGCNDTRIDALDDNGTPDIIITFFGGNDNVNGFTNDQFRYAYNRMLSKINEKYPNAYVFCITLPYSAYTGYNFTDERRIAFNEIIREVAAINQVTVIDYALYHTIDNYSTLYGDSMHFSKKGMDLLANTCYDTITEYFKEN